MRIARAIALLAAFALTLTLGACATDRIHHEGLAAMDEGRYEDGVRKLEEAARADPSNMTLRLDLKTQRESAIQRLIAAADTARRAGKTDDAEHLYARALALEAGNVRAQRGLEGVQADRRHAALIAEGESDLKQGAPEQAEAKMRAVLAEDPGFAPANALREKIDAARGPVTVVPRLHSRDNRPVTLQFRDANTKMVFEVLSRQTGINFIFDKDVRSDGKTTIFVQNVPVEQAIELVLGQNQLSRQVLSENMVLIYPNTQAKQKDYQDQIVKAIYLTNADPKQAQNLLKTMLNVKNLFIDERANEIVIRDTPEVVRMAEKLLASLDLPEPEVMMEVEVLEITRSKLQQLGINYPTGATVATPDNLTVHSLFHDQDERTLTVTPLSATVDLLKSVGVTNVLASPRIRARNKEKAKILIGSRVPVITNSVVLGVGGGQQNSSNVQYLDVGLTLEVEPTVYLDNDVSIKVNLEVSNITKTVQTAKENGSIAYELGTRDANTVLRLKDGETQILAGLINDNDSKTSAHIPGLGDIPILGRLFGSRRDSRDKTEIVLSITPRIIRSQPRPSSDTTEFWYGTESSVRSSPLGAASAAGATSGTAPTNGSGSVDLSNATAQVADAASPPPSSPPAEPVALTAPTVSARTAAPVAGAPSVTWEGPGEVTVGQDFDVTLRLTGGSDLRNIRAQVHYEPSALQLTSADSGDVVPAAAAASALPRINQIAGVAQFVVNATPDSPAHGEGSLMVLHFRALAPNSGTKLSAQVGAVTAAGSTMPPARQEPLTIVVSP